MKIPEFLLGTPAEVRRSTRPFLDAVASKGRREQVFNFAKFLWAASA
jgi:hypothetical protein